MWFPFTGSAPLSLLSSYVVLYVLLGGALVDGIAIGGHQEESHSLLNKRTSGISTAGPVYPIGTIQHRAHIVTSRVEVERRASRNKKPGKKPAKKAPKKPTKTPPKRPNKKPTKEPTKKPKKLQPWEEPVPSQSSIDRVCRVPKNKALFWSGVASTNVVYKYRDAEGFTTDVSAYPKGYTWRYRKHGRNPGDHKKNILFAERFSIAFAKKASGVVHIMVPWEKGPKPARYFHRYEWPILKRSHRQGKITKLVQVNPNNFEETRVYDPKRFGLSKRASEIDLDNVPWDVDLDALAMRWEQVNGERVG